MNPLSLWEYGEAILAAVNAVLVENGVNPPQRKYVSPGAPPSDDPCAGQLTVHLEDVYPFTTFPAEDPTGRGPRCDEGGLAAIFVVTLFRCVPTEGREGDHRRAPSIEKLQRAAQQTLLDQYAIARALRCLISDWDDEPEAAMGHITTVGVEGDSFMTEGRITVAVSDCLCAEFEGPVDPEVLLPGLVAG